MALDFAVTSGLRDVQACIREASSATTAYEDYKRGHLHTERLCAEDGHSFCPMVMEAVGGAWGPAAVKIFTELAKSKSMLTGESVDMLLAQLYQNLGTILRRENARAIIKRAGFSTRVSDEVLAAATTLQSPPEN